MKKIRKFAAVLIALSFILVFSTAAYGADEAAPLVATSGLSANEIKEVQPNLTKAASYSYNKIKLTWEPASGVDGYAVYRATSKSGKYTLVTSNVTAEKTSYINGSRTTGKTYFYKIRAYKLSAGKKVYSKYSDVKSTYARPNKADVTKIYIADWHYFGAKWSKVTGATGYQVYMKEKDESKYTFMGNFKSTTGKVKYLDASKEYDIKVRAYKTVNGEKVYGFFSEPESYIFTWDGADLKEFAVNHIKENYPEIDYREYSAITGELKTPENSSWTAAWPCIYSMYDDFEESKKDLKECIDYYVRSFKGDPEYCELGEAGIYINFIDGWYSVYMIY